MANWRFIILKLNIFRTLNLLEFAKPFFVQQLCAKIIYRRKFHEFSYLFREKNVLMLRHDLQSVTK